MKTLVEKAGLCALNRIFGFEPKIAHTLITHFGSATEIFGLGTREIDCILGPFSKFKGAICPKALDDAFSELESLAERGISFLGHSEPGYPVLLNECDDPPIGLYIRSSSRAEEIFNKHRNIAIIGTRDISPYGKEWCRKTVFDLASSKDRPMIISGLALGTDICAHTAALEAGLPTIGVMATGPDMVYPSRHYNAAQKIVETPGCALITDYPPGTAPMAIHFLRRNRIIAGLSEATLLIESKIKGGGMTTSRLAFSYNRGVYALPGRIDDIRSQGCNYLIQKKIAEPITSSESLLKSLGFKSANKQGNTSPSNIICQHYDGRMPEDRISLMSQIILKIKQQRSISVDELASSFHTATNTIRSLVELLEIDGFITIDILQRCSIKIRKSE